MNPTALLKSIHTILVIDWPSKEVPESLARAGFEVIVKGGPGPDDYSAYEFKNGEVLSRRTGRVPDHADLIYSYRPLSELPEIIALAKAVHAKTIWTQSGASAPGVDDPKGCWLPEEERRTAGSQIQAAGLTHITEPYIVDAVGDLQPSQA